MIYKILLICFACVGLDYILYKMHGTYIKIVEAQQKEYLSYIIYSLYIYIYMCVCFVHLLVR